MFSDKEGFYPFFGDSQEKILKRVTRSYTSMSEEATDNPFKLFQWYIALGSIWNENELYESAIELHACSTEHSTIIQEGICTYFQEKVKGINEMHVGDQYVIGKQVTNFVLDCADANFHKVVSAAFEQLPSEQQQNHIHNLIVEDFFVSNDERQNKIMGSPYTFINPYSKRTLVQTLQHTWR